MTTALTLVPPPDATVNGRSQVHRLVYRDADGIPKSVHALTWKADGKLFDVQVDWCKFFATVSEVVWPDADVGPALSCRRFMVSMASIVTMELNTRWPA